MGESQSATAESDAWDDVRQAVMADDSRSEHQDEAAEKSAGPVLGGRARDEQAHPSVQSRPELAAEPCTRAADRSAERSPDAVAQPVHAAER